MSSVGGSTASRPARSLSRRKGLRLLFRAVIVVVMILAMEFASLMAILVLYKCPATLSERRDWVAKTGAVHLNEDLRRPMMIHPYLGLVLQANPETAESAAAAEGKYRTTEFGFRDTGSPIRKRSPDRLIVVILGGSVARQFALAGSAPLSRKLASMPEFAGRSIEFVRMANDGYKEPQQLMALTWIASLGGEFDVVINLDGVNEAALPKIDNFPQGIRADYPRAWGSVAASARSFEYIRQVGYVTYLRDRLRQVAAAFGAEPWRSSQTALLLWQVISEQQERAIQAQQVELSRMTPKDLSAGVSGAHESFASDDEFYRYCVEIWARSSIQLHHLCAANGARYYHFLQPNQYVEPLSKPMNADEQSTISEASPFRVPVRTCYPLMQASAERFAREGVSFCDLSQVFVEHPEPIYVDDCCHVSSSGDEIMAEAIGEWIRLHPKVPPNRSGVPSGAGTNRSN